MKFLVKPLAVAMMLALAVISAPSVLACPSCGHSVVRHHVAMRTITRTRIVERTILQPAIVETQPVYEQTLPVVTERVAVPMCAVCHRFHHHLLGVSTPIFGMHIF